jgi:hypothetical protein
MAALREARVNDQLRVPTVAFSADVVCADGRCWTGQVFLPAAAPTHEGPARADEWMNDASPFFPFLATGESRAFLLNKREIVVLTVSASADAAGTIEPVGLLSRRVLIEAEDQRLEGSILIEMPDDHARPLDYLNRNEPFLTLRDGDRHHLIQKKRITRIVEIPEE